MLVSCSRKQRDSQEQTASSDACFRVWCLEAAEVPITLVALLPALLGTINSNRKLEFNQRETNTFLFCQKRKGIRMLLYFQFFCGQHQLGRGVLFVLFPDHYLSGNP